MSTTLKLPTLRRRRASENAEPDAPRGVLSVHDRRRGPVRAGQAASHVFLFVGLVVVGLGPLLWLAKAAVSTTQDIIQQPLALWPSGIDWGNLQQAWVEVEVGRYFFNTIALAAGQWVVGLVIATTGAYVLSILRPAYARVLQAAVLATLFVPSVVLLVPLFITVARPAFGPSLLNSYLGVWLPTAANAFNILVVKRFFDSLPFEVFEAARTDGAGPFRMFWSIVLPMSRPIVGVVSVFIIIASLKDYLWPKLVLPDAAVQPLGVRLPNIQSQTELDVTLAALAISTIIPVVLFLVFQRVFLRGAGLGGAVKG
ncbi:carbohydrate ABC transporter permease [Protaetiibacter intestinalis]|uniref:Carbohydrate ABC transporter permease n=1 Tax=Protaetiibacter intestinalis TaxID=2419774 RepID=A0A387B3L7_9MICO|nr:carbohydrate ABC transporter permease [Protaetiibacter intestinalis]AYF96897.1 carbohydrate ABC transporter permease [Protaetiibacter intestinalis]